MSEYLRTAESESELGPYSDEVHPEEGVPTGGVIAVTCFALKVNELPSCIAKDIFRALFVDDLAIHFRGRSLNAIKIHLQQAVNAIQEWATGNVFKFAAQKCKDILFSAPRSRVQRTPAIRIGNKFLSVEESTKFPRTVVGLAPFLYKGHQCAKDTLQGGSEPSPSGRSLEIPEIT